MPRFVAFLRGVSPTIAQMPALARCFADAGFARVRTVLATGNVVFDAPAASEATLERRAEAAMQQALGRSFFTIVRPVTHLQALLASDPFAAHADAAGAKRVVSFLREARQAKRPLPLAADGAVVLCQAGREAFTYYRPTDKGPVFMKLIEAAFGTEVTTRTWDTVAKCAVA